MTFSASPLPNAKKQFCDANGHPLAGGSVSYYIPATLTPKTTWADENQSVANPTTITLDGSGFAVVFGSGDYREIVKDANGVTLWDAVTNVPAGSGGGGSATRVITSGNITSGAWLTSGLRMQLNSATYTDTTSSGASGAVYVDAQLAPTITTNAVTTYSQAFTSYVQDPVAGTNATFTTKYALGVDSFYVLGASLLTGLTTVGAGAATTSGIIVVNGDSASTYGSEVKFQRAGTTYGTIGTESVVLANNNNHLAIQAAASGEVRLFGGGNTTAGLKVDASNNTTVAGTFTASSTSTFTGVVTLSSTVNKVTITAPASAATLTIANNKTFTASNSITIAGTDGKTLTVSNNLTLAGTDGTTMTFPTTSASVARTDAAQTFTGTQVFNGGLTAPSGQLIIAGTASVGFNFGLSGGDGILNLNTSGTMRLQYSNGTDGITISTSGVIKFPNIGSTGSAANLNYDSVTNGLQRVTSSIRYKTNVGYFGTEVSSPMLDSLQPINFTSLASGDDPTEVFFGFLAEDVAKQSPNLVNWMPTADLDQSKPHPASYSDWNSYISANQQTIRGVPSVPDSVMYDRLTTVLFAELRSIRSRLHTAGIA